ncbi:DUF1223 domain-containing protein [Chryseobacterium sp. T16E-39]|uniref:DUF1223 domain-containing protein n=1 Tax=Chryseobacterium sp. T16E-39 TaxID=2015076 RepID=UPI000B5B110D|nr:DUF1223 domain-containing protein [Chryseobacterium sp. T16E-39]ASK29822.1 DUF1223 domain-containing protein [Chryseobacterium sp. T16E-39]
MISKKLLIVTAFVALLFTVSAFVQKDKTDESLTTIPTGTNNGFAVLELFTSEGCSSCPPADALMGQIKESSKDQPVYILAYHVDYWNRLGWRDRFSTPENSERQQQYSRTLGSQVYTPQLVVNGKQQFVGSDKEAVENSVISSLSHEAKSTVDLKAQSNSKQITVNYKVTGNDTQNKLLITLVQKKASTNVAKGENEGRHLQHWQIVHKQVQVSLKNSLEGSTSFSIPENFTTTDWEIIGFIQNVKTGQITGASKAIFN